LGARDDLEGDGVRMSGPPILCVGALTADLMMQVDTLPALPGKYPAQGAALVAAGMATSAATAIARLGRDVRLWASAGTGLLGDFVIAQIERDGIDTRHVRRLDGVMTAVSAILVEERGERMVVPRYDEPLLATPSVIPNFEDFAAVLVDVRWPTAAAAALDGAREAGIPAVLDLDVGRKPVLEHLAGRADHIVASLAGARTLTGGTGPADCVEALAATYAATVVVTDGGNGAWVRLAGDGRILHVPAFAVNAVDTNAAGDVFHGAYVVAIVEGMEPAEAVRFASAAAAIKCTRYGGRTGAPTRAEVDAMLAAAHEQV
jgi:sulfofructose kinase